MAARWAFLSLILVSVVLEQGECAMSREQMEKASKGFRNNCISKTGADPAAVNGIREGNFPDDPNLKCYTYCIMKTLKSINDMTPDEDMLMKQVDIFMPEELQPRMKAVISKCIPEAVGSEKCEVAYAYIKCNQKTDPEAFRNPRSSDRSLLLGKNSPTSHTHLGPCYKRSRHPRPSRFSVSSPRAPTESPFSTLPLIYPRRNGQMREARLVLATILLLVILQMDHVQSRMTRKQFMDAIFGFRKRCVKRLGTPIDLVDGARQGNFVKDPALMCYQKCVFSMMKILKDDRLDYELLEKQVNLLMPLEMTEASLAASQACMPAMQSADSCEAAYEFVKCFYDKDSETYFFP
ncbi:uncharacterized protein [Prorops nasuta]|uniref:uncharacterized protein n=1 Tax=Prorops nasuta TaxID=863751 RepID=UPI0034CDDBAB